MLRWFSFLVLRRGWVVWSLVWLWLQREGWLGVPEDLHPRALVGRLFQRLLFVAFRYDRLRAALGVLPAREPFRLRGHQYQLKPLKRTGYTLARVLLS